MANEVATSGGAGSGLSDNEKMLAAVGYVCLCCIPTFLVPMFAAKESRFAQYHARQAAALYVVVAGTSILGSVLHTVLGVIRMKTGLPLDCLTSAALTLLGLGGLVLMVLGAVNAMQAKEAPLPVVGPLAAKLPF